MRKCMAEFFGTAFLLCTLVGSGIMGQNLSAGNLSLALLASSDSGARFHRHFRRHSSLWHFSICAGANSKGYGRNICFQML